MDAFAENQMGRGDGAAPVTPVVRMRRNSKEACDSPSEASQELLATDEVMDEEQPVEIPGMSCEESALIAARWERRKSVIMPVGDPYAEPDTSTPYLQQVAREYCKPEALLAGLGRGIQSIFPVISWLPTTTLKSFRADLIAGLTVGVMLIPQV